MFRSIVSVGRSALRTGAFSRQAMVSAEQPTFFNALRAFSDDAAGRSKGVVKWFGELLCRSNFIIINLEEENSPADFDCKGQSWCIF